jgi:hypothetical protein
MIYLGVEITDEVINGLGKKFETARYRAMVAAIKNYHRVIFPKHFFNSNRSRYQLAPRTQFYLKVIKPARGIGPGRFVDLLLKGTSRRRMMTFATIRASDSRGSFTLRMSAPTYFTRRLAGQPDKQAEAEQVNQEDRGNIRNDIQRFINAAWDAKKSRKTKRIR